MHSTESGWIWNPFSKKFDLILLDVHIVESEIQPLEGGEE